MPQKIAGVPIQSGTLFNAPFGEVTFYDGATVIGTMTQGASPYTFNAVNLARGSHTFSAKYAGNVRCVGSTSNTIAIHVQ